MARPSVLQLQVAFGKLFTVCYVCLLSGGLMTSRDELIGGLEAGVEIVHT